MPDILDETDFGQLRGTYPAKILYSDRKSQANDPRIDVWKIKWVIDDPDSVFHQEAAWETLYFYLKAEDGRPGFTEYDMENMTTKERGLARRRKIERTKRLESLGVADDDMPDVDVKQFTGFEAMITVNTNNKGYVRVLSVRPIEETSKEINIDI